MGAPSLQTCRLTWPAEGGAGGHLQRVGLMGPHVAQGVVQQVDQHAAQVLGIKLHLRLPWRIQHDLPPALAGSWACQSLPDLGHVSSSGTVDAGAWLIWCCTRAMSSTSSAMRARRSAFCCTMWARRFCAGSVQVFFQQRIGLDDGCQRVADFMGHGGRHAAHGSQLFGAQAGFHFAQVVQEHHAQPLGLGSVVPSRVDVSQVRTCRPGGALAGVQQV